MMGDTEGFVVNLYVCVPGAVGNGWGLGKVKAWGTNFNVFVEVQGDGA